MSYEALDWWYANAHRYVDLRTEPQLWVLGNLIARRTDADPRVGAWPSQKRMAEALGGVKHETVGRYIARLEAKGVIKVIPRGGPQERHEDGRPKEGRKPHLYLMPEVIAAHELPPTPRGLWELTRRRAPRELPPMSPYGMRVNPTGVTSDPRGGYLRSQRGLPPVAPLVGGAEGVLKGKKGGRLTPPPASFPDQCAEHQDGRNAKPCGRCGRQRERNKAARDADPAHRYATKRLAYLRARNECQPWDAVEVPSYDELVAVARQHPWCGNCDEVKRIGDDATRCKCAPPSRIRRVTW